ncbi:chorismate mutase [Mycobacterium sp. 3519A]|jgi:chorismate mutase|uniref:chorismate mutase n=1 Tax=Mycobacterium sp. 3519A TaxID=2057184 RepID=UPI000C7B82CF|nr:chorismate mutase [Mycobacterium sp. 3519A]
MKFGDAVRPCATALCAAVAFAMLPMAPARGDDANPLVALVDAAAQRLQTADPVAATKWIKGGSIEDPPRVEQVLSTVAADAKRRGVDSGYVRRIFTDQIDATTGIEYTRFGQWKLDPGSAPAQAPDLTASRDVIDRLNAQMVEQIAVQSPVLHSPDCLRTLDDAKAAVAVARTLDPLYRQGLDYSTHSYCGA